MELIANKRGAHLVVAAPLGLGKPHRLLNALYEAANSDGARSLRIYTALSLAPPAAGEGLQRRFLAPFLARHFGADFPVLRYVQAQRADALPANIEVQELLRDDFRMPPAAVSQDAAALRASLRAYRKAGLLPDYPLGSDFTPVEQRLVAALAWLKASGATWRGKSSLLLRALAQSLPRDPEALERMSLSRPASPREWIDARLLGLALARTADALR